MGTQGPERIVLSKERLEEGIRVMKRIMDACKDCSTGGISWSEACRNRGLDPIATRQKIMLNLEKLTGKMIPLETVEFDMYDGYEYFYHAVFGDRNLQNVVLPYDYKKSVIHVVKNTGLTERESMILMRHFGIGDYDHYDTLDVIGDDIHVTKDRVRQIEAKALRKCRAKERRDVLIKGITKYNQEQEQAKERSEQELELSKLEHEALMEKRAHKHEELMEVINTGTYKDALKKTLPDDLPKVLENTSISVLDLSPRPYNSLQRWGQITNLYELLRLWWDKNNLKERIMQFRNMGEKSAEEVITKMDEYIQSVYGVPADEVWEICFPKGEV